MHNPLTITPLGGVGNVNTNMYVYEYDNQLLLVDCGIGFPTEPGLAELYIPDIFHLKKRRQQIVGLVLTHGHDDHIAALPYVLPELGDEFPIYGSKLTLAFATDRVKEFGLRPNFKLLPDHSFELGSFTLDSLAMTHSVPDTRHIIITTPAGRVYHGVDFKFDLSPIDGRLPDFQKIAVYGAEGIDLLMSDCLNAEVESFSTSESTLAEMFRREMRGVSGKVLITVMSSNIHRVQQILDVAKEFGRKVAFVGRSIEQNVQTASSIGYLKTGKKILINKKKIDQYDPSNVCIVIAGSQGQEGSSLVRAVAGEHKLVRINKDDKIIFASDAIPGNEANVYSTIDAVSQTGAEVTYPDIDTTVHVSGHSSAIEQKLLIALTKPTHLIPIGGNYRHMVLYRNHARQMGYKDEQIHLIDNGSVVALNKGGINMLKHQKLRQIVVKQD